MLSRLHVVNYALIDDVEIEFGSGLNIITGETGAGKSILIGALGLVLGMRASAEVIRTGEKKCTVEAHFELRDGHAFRTRLEDQGIDLDEDELILRRDVLSEGRSRCYANGAAIPARILQGLGKDLVDLHGQHDHQSLLDVERHLDFLDGFVGSAEVRESVAEAHSDLMSGQSRLATLESDTRRLRERKELLAFQAAEIQEADPQPEEDEALRHEHSMLTHAEQLTGLSVQLSELLYEDEQSVADGLSAAAKLLDEATRMDDSLQVRVEELEALRYGAEELARFFTDYAQQVEYNPERLAEVTDRLETLNTLKKKYGSTLEEVKAYADEANRELGESEELESSIQIVRKEIEDAGLTFRERCGTLSAVRKKAAGRLASAIQKALVGLGMKDVQFKVRLDLHPDPEGLIEIDGQRFRAGSRGLEHGKFFLSTNPGEAVRPLARVASGGEISRIMLAMKTVLSSTDSVQVLIFDEIDIGISGRIAEVVGRKLKSLSRSCQTISITHLPQIAKMADRHFSVRKETAGRRSVTRVVTLNEAGRTEELAKMMGGEKISALTLEHAREMLAEE